jgi:hypothetical protein
MLLIDPPLTKCEWSLRGLQQAQFEQVLDEYRAAYEAAVLALPREQLAIIVGDLVQGLGKSEFRPELLYEILRRELLEEEFEPSRKVARLIVLCALADMLLDYGHTLEQRTQDALDFCRDMIPLCLTLAVDAHFGFLPHSS